jgi:dipeptidyl aminopeptidase/acylaminoacyl peptidase
LAAAASPVSYITGAEPPFLVMHGDRDLQVPFRQSELLCAALRAAGADATLVTLPGLGHGGREWAAPAVLGRVAEFFDRHLQPG